LDDEADDMDTVEGSYDNEKDCISLSNYRSVDLNLVALKHKRLT